MAREDTRLDVDGQTITAVAGQRSSPKSHFANNAKMFFRAKTRGRKIT